jgi:hypothetical protein
MTFNKFSNKLCFYNNFPNNNEIRYNNKEYIKLNYFQLPPKFYDLSYQIIDKFKKIIELTQLKTKIVNY